MTNLSKKSFNDKLLSYEDNVTLYNYLKDNNLSLKNFFERFVIKTDASDSVIHVAHGYLEMYAGYHNVK